jgi:hypothetical protein
LASSALLYRCNTWAIREQDKSRMAAEMKFMRTMAKNTCKIMKPMKIFYQNLK